MAKKNQTNHSDLGFEENNDLGFQEATTEELPSSATPFEPMSEKLSKQLSAFSGGAQQGLTFNHADELAGATGAGLDLGQNLLNQMGLAKPSPTQVDQQLKAQGFKGDLQNTMDLYKELRDSKRNELAAQEASNPNMTFAGNIAGGAALTGLSALKSIPMAQKAISPLMAELNLAKPVASLAKTAGSGAIAGGLTGAGASQGELLDMQTGDGGNGPMRVVDDAMNGAQTGAMLNPTMQLGMKGIQAIPQGIAAAGKIASKIPIVQDAVDAAKGAAAGKTYTGNEKQFQDELRKLGSDTVDMIKDLSNKKFEAKTKALEDASKKGDMISIEKSLDDMLSSIKILPEDSAEQVTAKTDVLNYVSKLRNGIKETIPAKVTKQEPSKGDYTKIKFNKPEVEKNLDAQVAKLKSMGQMASGQIDQVKTPAGQDLLLPKIISDKPVTGETLQALTPKELITKKPGVNTVPRPDLVTPEQTIQKIAPETQVTPSRLEELIKRLGDLRSEGQATKQVQSTVDAGKKMLKGDLETAVPNLPQLNKESHDVQELMKRLTGVEPSEIKSGFNESGTAGVKDRVTKVLTNAPDSPSKLEDVLQGFEGVQGLNKYAPEMADKIKQTAETSSKDLRLAKLASGQAENTEGVIKSLVGGFGGLAVKGGEAAGKASRAINNAVKGRATQVVGSTISTFSKKNPEEVQMLAEKAVQRFGQSGQKLAKMLYEASTKSPEGRTAIIFGMMQKPEFREQLNTLHDEETPADSE